MNEVSESPNANTHLNLDSEYINPSLGQIGTMYLDARNNRIKYFSTKLQSEQAIEDSVQEGISQMKANGASRLNARFFFRGHYDGPHVEARIPLAHGYEGIELLFLGVNTQNRSSPECVRLLEDDILVTAFQNQHERRPLLGHYIIEPVTPEHVTERDIRDMVQLYQEAFTTYTTELDADSVRSMVQNSIVYAARYNGQIVSTSVAEIGNIPTEIHNFRICELSEMATSRDHRGQGLVTHNTTALMNSIRDEVDLIYAEARSCNQAINTCFRNLGFDYGGRLERQCILSGDADVAVRGPYEDLNVWYMLPGGRR